MASRVHIFGASGSGTTTLGHALASQLGYLHLDSDDFYWKSTAVRFSVKRPVQQRIEMIKSQIEHLNDWVLSGSLISWGGQITPSFSHAIYIQTAWQVREKRLISRERSRYGKDIFDLDTPQGVICREFLEWAERYDSAGLEQRSHKSHTAWMHSLPEQIKRIKLDGSGPIDLLVNKCIESMR